MPAISTSKGKLSGNGTADTVGNQSLAEPHPDHLRNLVLNYLCHNCYLKTAEAFVKDSVVRHLDEDGDEIDDSANEEMANGPDATSPLLDLSDETVRHILLRQRIQFEILSGNVHEATDLLNQHFPSVLAVDDSGASSETEVADENADDPSRLEYVAETVNPVHLSLNLRILAFIEACRTVPLVYPGTRPSGRASGGPRSAVSSPDSDSDMVMVAAPPPSAVKRDTREEEIHQEKLLKCVQKLYATVNALAKSEDRAIYLKELSNVGGLLAYTVPENSPMAKYLHQERRDRVAEQINSAILHHTGMPSVSYVERAVRYMHCLWAMLHELRVKVPAAHRPRGVSLPLGTGSQGAREPDKETFYEARPFDLQLLLNTRT